MKYRVHFHMYGYLMHFGGIGDADELFDTREEAEEAQHLWEDTYGHGEAEMEAVADDTPPKPGTTRLF